MNVVESLEPTLNGWFLGWKQKSLVVVFQTGLRLRKLGGRWQCLRTFQLLMFAIKERTNLGLFVRREVSSMLWFIHTRVEWLTMEIVYKLFCLFWIFIFFSSCLKLRNNTLFLLNTLFQRTRPRNPILRKNFFFSIRSLPWSNIRPQSQLNFSVFCIWESFLGRRPLQLLILVNLLIKVVYSKIYIFHEIFHWLEWELLNHFPLGVQGVLAPSRGRNLLLNIG